MNRVTRRAWIMMVFIAILVGGMLFFLYEYATQSSAWVVSTGSPHVYNNSNIGCGLVTDREGLLLLDTRNERTYSPDLDIRKSTLHWVGDRSGNISATAIAHYAEQMAGFDLVNGVYSYGGTGGQAVLTLSARVQTAALEAMGSRKGTIAVYNYQTGEILCAVSAPTYDPDNVPDIAGDTSGAYEGVYLNRFTQSTYIPGSIFKIVTTAAALESVEGIKNMTFTCYGSYDYNGDKVTCERSHGTLNLASALANSCNCSFAQISELVGSENMMAYVEKYGIIQSIAFDGISTASGNYDVTDAAAVELAWSCIGQYTDQINPCAFLTFMGAIANGGAGAQPYLVQEILVDGDVTYRARTTNMDRIMSADLARELQELMRNNVLVKYGAENFAGMTVCAKSGTSELGGGLSPNAMFAGFVTDPDYPLAFIVVVEQGGYGASTCIPILSQVLAACRSVLDAE